ncbi:NosD domain-containing protein [Candidatus Nitrosocosmicus agrestis]|uniref:NosD domain-containing protein n=1 Tax=Candidatus Nitrosocosmicus agrestis TaxID=2563600 RepID=UPI0013318012|nr:right-handed parallel beta-helix repeat-containing protein [Candidatus Nitrosocosmicus sp. SS]
MLLQKSSIHSCTIVVVFTLALFSIVFSEQCFSQINTQNVTSTDCNIYINHSQTLKNSIMCNYENGIIINDNNITLDLNSSELLGSGYLNPYTGIIISDKSNILLKGSGSVGHYQTGLLIDNSTNIDISSLNFTANEISILVKNSSYIKIDDNNLFTNTAGVKLYTVNNSSISNNYFESNDISAISLFTSKNNTLNNNSISSSLNGIYLDPESQNITIDSNRFSRSFGVDINLGNGGKINQSLGQVFNNTCHVTIPELLCAKKDN